MNRRTALMLSMLGGLVPAEPLGADGRPQIVQDPRQVASRRCLATTSRDDQPASGDEAPAPFPPEPGFQWKRYPIARYTSAASNQTNPQKAIIDWIFKRTGLAEWHGDKIAVLSASRTELRAYNSPDVLKQVDEVVEQLHQRRRRCSLGSRPVCRRGRYPLAILGLQPAHFRGQRPPGSTDLDDASR